jgi:lysophospholipase L1-like esterase
MRSKIIRFFAAAALCVAFAGLLAGCSDDDGGGGLSNANPGDNNLMVVAAFGDSMTYGSGPYVPYPSRLAPLIGKTVHNAGISGSKAVSNVGRMQSVVDRYKPAYVLVLYGINDVIHSESTGSIVGALDRMILIAKQNNVVPVIATYPMLWGRKYGIFAASAGRLNEGIRGLASTHGIPLVDLEKEFMAGGVPNESLYSDGLHPNDAGTDLIALAFASLF